MHPFASYVLRTYYKSTGWNEDNLYGNLTRSSNAILDFTVPRGLHFTISKSPNPLFKTSYSMAAMPSLNGSIGYIFTSCDLNVKSSRSVAFKDVIERFKIYDQPRRPEAKEEEWLGGERVDRRDYLMYGRFYLPTGRLDALYSVRLSPTVQAIVAAISDPPSSVPAEMRGRNTNMSNVMLSLQHDVGKWCTEYNYSAEDGMWGMRFLHNFGRLGIPPEPSEEASRIKVKRVDEEDAVEGGLKGRVSIGAEIYFSAKEKSAGVSTGIRFTTLPDATPPSAQVASSTPSPSPIHHQPPTTVTCLFNPMLGHISAAYTAKTSRDLTLSTRFDFNVYSFESEWTMGAEYWLRRKPHLDEGENSTGDLPEPPPKPVHHPEFQQDVQGVLKAKMTTNNDVSLLWEGRIRNMLVGLGLVSDLSSRAKPIKAIGLELSYFSSE
ncbi:mitochondrial distribution and morphology protein 10 [Macrolepiota fuliginosa MF-IS2]|uniref:Mitochondrial distribution and morphology protein 10 n=1 Tax=Macrolepiota fuliginosa MF-IS2 TaxID=1400762 RepID=A0A9P5XGQ5_9AGAR|nr:mitochondrial distribution and morphology protein 10 [Macrolepiota fuliginosa MF-IS2]